MNSKESYKVNKCLKPIKSNQIKSSCLGIALGSRIQGEVSIHYVLRFFSLDLYKICVPITLARFENIKTLRITHTNKPPPLGKMSFSVMLIFRNTANKTYFWGGGIYFIHANKFWWPEKVKRKRINTLQSSQKKVYF